MEEKYGEIAKYLRIEMMERSEKTNDKTDFVKNTNWLEEQQKITKNAPDWLTRPIFGCFSGMTYRPTIPVNPWPAGDLGRYVQIG